MAEEVGTQPRVGPNPSRFADWISGNKGKAIGLGVGILALVVAFLTYRAMSSGATSMQTATPGTNNGLPLADTTGGGGGLDTLISSISGLVATDQNLIQMLQGTHTTSDGAPAPASIITAAPITAPQAVSTPPMIAAPAHLFSAASTVEVFGHSTYQAPAPAAAPAPTKPIWTRRGPIFIPPDFLSAANPQTLHLSGRAGGNLGIA